MNAMYFYNRLLGYEEEARKTRNYYYGYSNGTATIHHKSEENVWFVIYRDGQVLKHTKDGCIYEALNIKDLPGDDFERFNSVQIFKLGYVVLPTKTEYEVKIAITDLHHLINSYDDDLFRSHTRIDGPILCGGSSWKNGGN